jgi:hypothetical protein
MKKGNYPKIRLGEWMYESHNYVSLGVDQEPKEIILNRPFRVSSQKDGFVFFKDLEGANNAFGVWRDNGTNCYNKLYAVINKIGLIGVENLYIKERDKCKRVNRFVGNFVESGFIPETNTRPVAGYVNAYWVKD